MTQNVFKVATGALVSVIFNLRFRIEKSVYECSKNELPKMPVLSALLKYKISVYITALNIMAVNIMAFPSLNVLLLI